MTKSNWDDDEIDSMVELAIELRGLLFDDATAMMQGAMVGKPSECIAFAKWWIQRAKGIKPDHENVFSNQQTGDKMTRVQLQIIDNRLNNSGEEGTFPIPDYATAGAAGIDLRAMFSDLDDYELKPGETILIPTGIAVNMPENLSLWLIPRSGLGHKNGIVLGNLVGLVDEDFTKQIYISCWNRNKSGEPFRINLGDRIAQGVFVPVAKVWFDLVEGFEDNGRGGFGSTSIK
jgi:dUTP pyrophosphatase